MCPVKSPWLLDRLTVVVIGAALVSLGCARKDQAQAPVPRLASSGGSSTTAAKTEEHRDTERAPAPSESQVESNDPFAVELRQDEFGTVVRMHPKTAPKPVLMLESSPHRISIEWDDRQRSEQTDMLREMLSRLRDRFGEILSGALLQISLGDRAYPEYVERLMGSASRDPVWQRARDRGERALHEYIVQVTRTEPLLPELDRIFSVVGLRPVIKFVEKCSTMVPDSMPAEFKGRPASKNLHGHRPLPAGCQMAEFELLSEK